MQKRMDPKTPPKFGSGAPNTLIVVFILIIAAIGGIPKSAAQASKAHLAQIATKLDQVPVYYLVNEDGSLHVVRTDNEQSVAPVFFYRQSAESLRQDLSTMDSSFTIKEAALGQIYLQLAERKSNEPRFALIGDPGQVMLARIVNEDHSFNAVPVFSVRQGSTGSHLTMLDSEGEQVVPLFIESQRVKTALSIMQKQNSAISEDLGIVAISLETVVSDMVNGSLPYQKVRFIPPQ